MIKYLMIERSKEISLKFV